MFIEVLHDTIGNIVSCYCSDTLPVADGSPFAVYSRIPEGCAQARINIDTLTAMEIDEASGLKAVINPDTGLPEIKKIDRTEYIMQTFRVDVAGAENIPVKPLKNIPVGMKMKGLVRK